MNRRDFIKAEWLRCTLGIFLTVLLPFSLEWENPAGAPPCAIIAFLAIMFWVGFIGMMCISDKQRADFILGHRP